MAGQCCGRPKLSDFGLNTDDPSVFSRAQYEKIPKILFIIYRVVIALYIFGITVAYLINQIEFFGGVLFVYLTNLGFFVFFFYLVMAAVTAVADTWILRTRTIEEVGIRHKIQCLLFNITLNVNIIVTLIYWSFLYDPSVSFFYDFHVHSFTTIVSLLDLFLTAMPVRFLHLIYPMGFGIAYLIMTLIYWGAGGVTRLGDYIYSFINYTESPGLAAGVACGVLIGVVLVQLLVWGLYKLRMWMWVRCSGDGRIVQSEDPGKMEEGL
ncbi:protein rolling stone-like [Asterias rubens]|uniref:protein rolling stone-like n=1 Tax=Asterias rubens TaxID=7604 RepID=UPI001455A0FA|nr:protein rolling stone-like [Asterias rubens]